MEFALCAQIFVLTPGGICWMKKEEYQYTVLKSVKNHVTGMTKTLDANLIDGESDRVGLLVFAVVLLRFLHQRKEDVLVSLLLSVYCSHLHAILGICGKGSCR